MKFGVLQFFSWPERRVPIETVYERALQRIEIMDKAGYDAVWLAEHHFTPFSVCPSVHMMATVAAMRTKRLRIGTGVSLVPFYHPLRLAEEIALLDILSGGRVNWGAGRGYQKKEFEAFGVDGKESYQVFREFLRVVIKAWTDERVSFKGDYIEVCDVEVLPKPIQKPHPPIWLASSSAESISWAASQGFSILLDPVSTHRQIAHKYDLYCKTLRENGHSIEGRDIPMARLICVEDTMEKAREVAARGLQWYVGSHKSPGLKHVETASKINREHVELFGTPFSAPVEDEVERYMSEGAIVGTPEACIDQIDRLREEMHLEYLLCAPLSHNSFKLITEKVLPRYQ